MNAYLRRSVDAAEGYVPGEQPRPGEVKLNTNENPFPPSPRVRELLQGWDTGRLRIYPEPTSRALREAAGRVWGLPAENILAGNGSDEILAMLFRAVLEPGERVVFTEPSYILYDTLTRLFDGVPAPLPCGPDFSLPEELDQAPARLVLLASPNPPAGRSWPNDYIARICRANLGRGVVVVDEAYVDFADANALPLLSHYENLVIARTLSKSYSLAGLRVGFALGSPAVLEGMDKVRDSYNVDCLAQAIAVAALEDQEYFSGNVSFLRSERRRVREGLMALGFHVPESQANFVFASHPAISGRDLFVRLRERGLLYRYFSRPGMNHGVRITIGAAEHNDRLLAAAAEILASTRVRA
ncbi:histidinol-phosphate transaminase [bacterium]|nr:histidinol-phosphate transaminase [bacterium]